MNPTGDIGVLIYHRFQKLCMIYAQLLRSCVVVSDRVGPRPSGHWQSTFPDASPADTFEPERFRASQCEGFQLEHQSPPKLCFAEGRLTIIHLAAARAPWAWLHAAPTHAGRGYIGRSAKGAGSRVAWRPSPEQGRAAICGVLPHRCSSRAIVPWLVYGYHPRTPTGLRGVSVKDHENSGQGEQVRLGD